MTLGLGVSAIIAGVLAKYFLFKKQNKGHIEA